MPVPDYQTLMLPLLKTVAAHSDPIRVRDFLEPIADEFGLTPEERALRIPSGQENLIHNRLFWAKTYLTKAGLLSSPKRGMVEMTARGTELLSTNPTKIDNKILKQFPEFVQWQNGSKVSSGGGSKRRN